MFVILTYLRSGITARPKVLESSMVTKLIRMGLTTISHPCVWVCQTHAWSKNLKFFKSMIEL